MCKLNSLARRLKGLGDSRLLGLAHGEVWQLRPTSVSHCFVSTIISVMVVVVAAGAPVIIWRREIRKVQ